MTFNVRNSITAALVAGTALAGLAGTASAATLEEIQEAGTIRIAVANEIPYGFVDPSGEAKGAGPDIAKLVVEELGIENIEWVTTNFSSLIPGLQADRFDVAAAEMAIQPERCQEVIYSEPNTSYGEGLLVAAGNPEDIHSYEEFAENEDLTVAVMAGANQLEMMQKLGVSQDRIVTIASNSDAISTVSTGRADAYAATGLTANQLAEQGEDVELASDFSDPVIEGSPQRSWGGYAFANESTDLRDAWNEALATIKESDQWAEIVGGYGFTQEDMDGSFEQTTEELCSSE